ncbi:MAG: TolC family protein [Planctomycetota bacterium]
MPIPKEPRARTRHHGGCRAPRLHGAAPSARAPFTNPGALHAVVLSGALAAAALLGACKSAEEYAAAADSDVYALVAARRAALVADPDAFSIEPPANSLRQRILAADAGGEALEIEPLELGDALEIAFENSRDASDRREQLYRAALDLTLERWRFGWQPTAGASANLSGSLEETESWSGGADLGLTKLLGSGARIVGGIGISLFENLLGSDGVGSGSDFSLSVNQPLLRGFGFRITTEPLTQAERDLVYEVRSYERFRRTFAFDVATRYFRLLQAIDSVKNEIANQESVELVARRNEALSRAGRLSDIELDQAKQNQLTALNRVIDAQQDLESQIDDFKLFLGLPISAAIEFDSGELERLGESELEEVELSEDEAVAIALSGRLDYLNSVDRVDDARRRAEIAEDALRGGLGLVAQVNGSSDSNQPLDYRPENVGWSVGLDLDLPIDQLPERNSYRSALISLDATRRGAEEFADSVTVAVRDALRNLASRAEAFSIQDRSAQLAERRVASASRNLEAGRAQTRDLLESQQSLLDARNARTRALIDFRLAQLGFWRDLEVLSVENGRIEPDGEALAQALALVHADGVADGDARSSGDGEVGDGEVENGAVDDEPVDDGDDASEGAEGAGN